MGNASISGLPFASINTTGLVTTFPIRWAAMTTSYVYTFGELAANASAFSILGVTAATATPSAITDAGFSGTSIIRFEFFYFT